MSEKPIVGITMGDPAGNGPEITVKALSHADIYDRCRPIVVGDAKMLEQATHFVGRPDIAIHRCEKVSDAKFTPGTIDVLHLELIPDVKTFPIGQVSVEGGNAAFQCVKKVIELALAGEVDATCTNALNKEAMNKALEYYHGEKSDGYTHFDGHTEIYATYTHTKKYTMMLAHHDLRVVHVSTHVSLREACDRVKKARVLEVIDTEPMVTDGTQDAGKPGEEGEIEFRNVSFAYPDSRQAMLEGVNFKAKKGQTVAFIGSTGSGKSSLINLVPRFYDATQGEVLVDGVNVRDYKLKALRDKIGYVPQQSFLFKGTIASNVAYGDTDRDDDTVRRACDVAQATEFIDKKQKKYDSGISQGGSNVSGGQKQRLSIARAVYRHPEILIFDDSFSALDFKTDRAVRDALEKEAKDSTKLIVAQRIGTIMNADRIIVLDDGKVVGQGTHEELLDNCEVYRQIAESQLSEDELKR